MCNVPLVDGRIITDFASGKIITFVKRMRKMARSVAFLFWRAFDFIQS